jgi:tetratricopeptide (TPR) repeat protein
LLESVAESLNNPKILDILGGLYYSLEKYEDADAVYRAALREDGYNVDFIVKSARILWKLGDVRRAFKRLKLGYSLDSLDISEERKLDKFLLDFIRNSDLPQSYYYLKKIRSWYSNYKKRNDLYF